VGLRGARVEVERRLDGSLWVRFRGAYLSLLAAATPPSALGECENPALFAGFPSAGEKSGVGLFHGAAFSPRFTGAGKHGKGSRTKPVRR
jgi:hypothetical protein